MNHYLAFLKRRFLWALAGLVVFLSYTQVWGPWFVGTLLGATGLAEVSPTGAVLTAEQWSGLVVGSVAVMSPAIIGFLAYVVAWIGWPGRPIPRRRRLFSTLGMGMAIAVTAFMLVGLLGNYWPVSEWRIGAREFAGMADLSVDHAEWVGDMYFGLLLALIGLYTVIVLCAAVLPAELDPTGDRRGARPGEPDDSAGPRPADDGLPAAAAMAPDEYFASRLNPWELEAARKEERKAAKVRESASSPDASLNGADRPVTGIWWPYAAGGAVVGLSVLAAVWPHLP